MDVTRHVKLIIRRGSQFGNAGSESVIVTATDVSGVRVVAAVDGGLLEVGIKFVFVLAFANLLDQEEDGTSNDGDAN